jgi:7-keto-8-aminopelargonate synthetase-like enzyme
MLMIDEAHSVGVVGASGRGVAEHFGVPRDAAEFWSGTLSKAFASFGGYVAGAGLVIRYLRYTAGGFVFSAGLPPADAAAALAALQIMRAEPERAHRVQENARLFCDLARQAGLDTGLAGGSPVVPVFIRDEDRTLRLALRLHERGINVNPVVYPGVARGEERLRFFVTASHSAEQIRRTIEILAGEFASSTT